eukprot:110984-Amphidinium_carterae.1
MGRDLWGLHFLRSAIAWERLWPKAMRHEFPEFHLDAGIKERWTCLGLRCNNVHAMPYISSFTWNQKLERLVLPVSSSQLNPVAGPRSLGLD